MYGGSPSDAWTSYTSMFTGASRASHRQVGSTAPETSLVTVGPDFPLPPSWRGKEIEPPERRNDVPKDEQL